MSRDIPRSEWPTFLQELSLEREGWIASFERIGVEAPRTSELTEHEVEQMSFELEEDHGQVRIELNDQVITIDSPARISVAEVEGDKDEIIEFEGRTVTYSMHLRFPRATVASDTGEEAGLPSDEAGLEPRPSQPKEDELRKKGGG